MRVSLTAASLQWLSDKGVFLHALGRPRLKPGDRLEFREDCELEPYVGIFAGTTVCRLGFMSYSYSLLHSKMTVGRYCSIANDVDANPGHHPLEHVSTSPFTSAYSSVMAAAFKAREGGASPDGAKVPRRPAPVLEHDVWIGAHSILLPNVVVGTGAVVAANAVVTHSVGPYEIVAGNPARLIRRRFPDDVIAGLLASEWWLYRFTDFVGLAVDQPDRFIEGFLKRKPDLEPYRPEPVRMAEMPRA